jgi:hypothetical protein
MPYASNNNAVLIDNCNNLENLSVLLEITEDVATTDGSGWSFQLNCYPPPGQYCQTSQVNWMQYVVYVQNGNLTYEVQYWSYGSSIWPPGYTPQPNTTPWLPCWANDYFLSGSFASIRGDTLPRQSSLQIALSTNDAGGVTKVQFIYTDPDGNAHPAEFDPPAVHPIVACELNLVGPGGSANANFTQGLTSSRGIIYYSVSSGQLSVQNGGAGSACGEVGVFTAETSNMTYSDISDAPDSTVTQPLQQPVDCAVNNLFAARTAHLGDMRQVRDSLVAQHPAGQWIIEVLSRHAADLAILALRQKGRLARHAQDILLEALHTIRDKRSFESKVIDEAHSLVEQVSGKLPPSMIGIAPAATTILESLRGRTLEEGLKLASRTIRPRRQARSLGACPPCDDRLTRRVAQLEERVSRLEKK